MRLRFIFFVCCVMIAFFGALMFIPGFIDSITGSDETSEVFFSCGVLTLLGGAFGALLFYQSVLEAPRMKEMFILTSSVWFSVAFCCALPFYFSDISISLTDAFFESVSGFTSTGATVLTGLETYSKGFLLWRAMTQWIGGLGIIILAIAILPMLQIGGMQLFATENSDNSGKNAPLVAIKMKNIILIYLSLSILCAFFLFVAGMTPFEAITHMMATVSTGGFSTYDTSIGHFEGNNTILWILTFFMTICSLPFVFISALVNRQWEKVRNDTQAKTFLFLLFFLILPISIGMYLFLPFFESFWDTLTIFAFQVVSIISTTGFVYENYTNWGPFFIAFFLFLTMIGGCTGSTAGGIKIFRFNILFKALRQHLQMMLTPHAVIIPRYNDKPITENIFISIIAFLTIFFLTATVSTLILSLTGLDFITSFSATLTCLANVGPGIGSIVGPDQNFSEISNIAKWVLSIVMILGRLEFMTIIVLFLPTLWKRRN